MGELSPQAMAMVQHMIASSLLWVFAAIVGLAVMLWLVTSLMRDKKPAHSVSKMEAFDAGLG